jgi:hypothetical protein
MRIRVVTSIATTLSIGCLALALFSFLHSDEAFRDPTHIFWWVGLPLLVGVFAAALRVAPPAGRLALASLLATVALVEGGFGAARRWTQPDVETWVEPEYYQPHERLGYAPRAGIVSRAWKRVDGSTVYDVQYTIDELGRRATPLNLREDRSRFLLLFGGSFAFGEGVGDRETLSFFLAERAPRTMPYSYGFHGYGPQHLLARLESGQLPGEVAESDGDLVYLFIDSHVNRAIGSMVVYTGWADSTPNYVLDSSGVPLRRGTLTTGRPLTSLLYSVLGRSQTLAYLGVDIPPRITERHIDLTARILARSAELFRAGFGAGRFAVVIFPGSAHAEPLAAALGRLDVEFLDYSGLLDYGDPRYFIAEDWHPSPLTHRILAERIVEDLALATDPETAPE